MSQALDDLLSHLAARKSSRPIVVFDLDDTLLSTNRRHQRILREYAGRAEPRLKHADATRRLAGLRENELRYSILDTAKDVGLTDEHALKDLREFWFHRFFANEYLLADYPVPGAAEYCRAALERGARVVYFTGRDEGMRSGTMASLERWGFPRPDKDGVLLVLKPRFDMPDLEYKRDGIRRIAEMGEVAASFENEPAHVNLFHEAFPQARHFLVETKHSGKPVQPHSATIRIPDFLRKS